MLVSIIIPVYNGEKYLRKAIESAINETIRREYEIIVVDDGSTDGSADIAREYMWDPMYQGKVTLLRHETNKGTATALNTGIKEASGKWIRWLGADDELLPDAIEVMMGRIQNTLWTHPVNHTIFYTNYHIINENGDRLGDHIEPMTPPDLWTIYYGASSTAMIHRDVFEKCGLLDESLRSSEDYEFWLRCNKIHGVQLQLIPVFTINYRKHDKQLTEATKGGNDPAIREKIKSMMK